MAKDAYVIDIDFAPFRNAVSEVFALSSPEPKRKTPLQKNITMYG